MTNILQMLTLGSSRMSLSGRWVAVVGASSGLGRAIAMRLAKEVGAKPILIGRNERALLALQQSIEQQSGVSCDVLVANQCNPAGRKAIVARMEQFGAVAAILSAAITLVEPLLEGEGGAFEHIIETNVTGFTDLLTRISRSLAGSPHPTGILAISSLAGSTSLPGQAVYGASKSYMNALVQALDVELGNSQLRVGVFVPGGIDTPMVEKSHLRWSERGLMNVDRCAALAVEALIMRKRRAVPGFGNKLVYIASRILPGRLMARLVTLPYRRAD